MWLWSWGNFKDQLSHNTYIIVLLVVENYFHDKSKNSICLEVWESCTPFGFVQVEYNSSLIEQYVYIEC